MLHDSYLSSVIKILKNELVLFFAWAYWKVKRKWRWEIMHFRTDLFHSKSAIIRRCIEGTNVLSQKMGCRGDQEESTIYKLKNSFFESLPSRVFTYALIQAKNYRYLLLAPSKRRMTSQNGKKIRNTKLQAQHWNDFQDKIIRENSEEARGVMSQGYTVGIITWDSPELSVLVFLIFLGCFLEEGFRDISLCVLSYLLSENEPS